MLLPPSLRFIGGYSSWTPAVSLMARRMGMKQSLMAAYINGTKKPSLQRENEIINTIKQIGKELIDARI
jgi:hypothetical protein